MSSLTDIPLSGTPLVECPFSDFLAIPSQRKQDQSPSSSLDHHPTKRTHVCSPEVEVGVELSSTQSDQDMPKLVLETGSGPSSEQGGQEPASLPSPSSAIIGPVGGTMAGSPKSTEDLASSSSELSRGDVDDSDMDTVSGDCLSCSDTDDASVHTTHKKYRKRVQASCKLSKSNIWMETQQKRINNSHQDIWGNDHKINRTEQKHALAEDHTSFKMQIMTTRTDQ